jgi:beta-phosphoglucomutase-like phosphatase (HAD superfamily)
MKFRHSPSPVVRLEAAHQKQFDRFVEHIDALPGEADLLRMLRWRSIAFAIATSGAFGQTNRLLAPAN